jgi:hypothetical protein
VKAFTAAARKFQAAVALGAATTLAAWLVSDDWRATAAVAIGDLAVAFGVYWAPNKIEPGDGEPPVVAVVEVAE